MSDNRKGPCPYCYAENEPGPKKCGKCGVLWSDAPFLWKRHQLHPCSQIDCRCNNRVHYKARHCPVCKSWQKPNLNKVVSSFIIEFFDSIFIAKGNRISAFEQLAMYLGIVIGVYFSSRIKGGDLNKDIIPNDVLVSGLVALLIMPATFEKISFKPDTPFLIRFGFYFQSGVFADSILSAIEDNF